MSFLRGGFSLTERYFAKTFRTESVRGRFSGRSRSIHCHCCNGAKVQACLLLKILDHITVKIRQMAVATTMQQKGVGIMLMTYAENFCALNNYTIAELHARKTAIGFYQKLGYQSDFVEFEEVGILHVKMTKNLS
ncbi:MAG: GNAT family N-acetyltransferase [Bacteroidetes bacterium]|nr:GNAT family N-acetyltransferase [Bacteroidota bacterium]